MAQAVYLGIVFLAIITLLAFRRPLYQAILGGLVMTAVLYRIPPEAMVRQTENVFTQWGSLSVLISLYLITYLQRMLEARQQVRRAQRDLDGLFHNRRINASVAPLFIGLLPSAAAMLLCGDIVKDATQGYLKPRDQAFVTSWFRHIPESTLPTYASVLLMSNLSGVPLPQFMMYMVIPMLALAFLGYWPCIHKLPKDPGTPKSLHRSQDLLSLFRHLWSLLLILVLILAGHISVVPAVLISIIACVFVYRFGLIELIPMIRSAFEWKLLFNTFLVLVLKEFLDYTGVLQTLPDLLSALPIPGYLIFSLLFFMGGVISGAAGIIALGTPIAFASIHEGIPLMVLLMGVCHAASQVSPVHVCLVVASDYYHVSMGSLIRRTLPVSLLFCLFMIGYYNILILLK